jgi:hypothetical protein
LQNNLKRTQLPSNQPGVFYLVDATGTIVGEWKAFSPLERAVVGTSVVEIAWFDETKVAMPREMVN